MKRVISLVLVMCMMLSLGTLSCLAAGSGSDQAVKLGEKLPLDFADLVFDEVKLLSQLNASYSTKNKNSSSSNSMTISPPDGMNFFCLIGSIKNTDGAEYDVTKLVGEAVFDDKYTYPLYVEMAFGGVFPSKLAPLTEGTIYIYASIPDELAESFTSYRFSFGMEDSFAEPVPEAAGDCANSFIYEAQWDGSGSSVPADASQAEDGSVFEPVKTGDVISLDFVEISVGGVKYADKLSEKSNHVTYSYTPSNEDNVIFWLGVTLKNVSSTGYQLAFRSMVNVIFDDKYTYKGEMRNLVGGSGMSMDPLVENNIYICAEVPRSIAEEYESVAVQFGFNENFEQVNSFNDTVETLDYQYEFRRDLTDKSEEDADMDDGTILISKGDTITTDEYEFTLNKVELTYELLPSNTSSYYRSYPADAGKVYLHIDASVKNLMKRDIRIDELFSAGAVYSDGYEYTGFVVINDGDSDFDWVSSYVAAAPLATCHAHGLVECPVEVDKTDDYLCATMKLSDGNTYKYVLRSGQPVGWHQEGDQWYYYNDDGTMVVSDWVKDGRTWYYMKEDGTMAVDETVAIPNDKGFLEDNGFDESGAWIS